MRKKIRNITIIGLFVMLMGSAIFAKSVYPLNTNVTLTWWMELHANVALIAKNFGDTEFAKELQKRTGVKIKFLHPAAGQSREAFNLMLASGDLPDIVEYTWYAIPGGLNSALESGYIQKLNPIIDKWAPNFKKYFKTHPEYDRMAKTDEGNYLVFPFVRGDETLIGTSGDFIRKDWLDDLGLSAPETLDEWYTVLKAFKEKKGATAPLCVQFIDISPAFAGGSDNFGGFYVDRGKVRNGMIEPSRKAFLETMRKWYAEGLLDKNFSTVNRKIIDANILGGKSGATFGPAGSTLGRYLEAMEANKDLKFNLVSTKYPSPKKGQKPRFANRSLVIGGGGNNGNAAITTKCKNVEAAARLLDYAYSPEGWMLYNFGIEGVTYKMVDKYPQYTEFVLRNPEKLSNTQIMSKYMRGHTNGPFVQDKRYLEQYYERQQQKDAVVNWKANDYGKYMMPPVTPSPKESEELVKLMNELNTYNDEMTLKFIMGVESLDNFDKYVAQQKKLGMDRAIQLNQAAYERYMKRK